MHRLFGFGAAIVIIGVLFKVLHIEIGFLTGNLVLGIGLAVEAFIFTLSAFQVGEIKSQNEDRIRQLEDIEKKKHQGSPDGLAAKIDQLLIDSKVDVTLINNLAEAIKKLESTAHQVSETSKIVLSSEAFGNQLEQATARLTLLANSYQNQAQFIEKQETFNVQLTQNMEQINQQMAHLNKNLTAINQVYDGMLVAMKSPKN
ncbi:MAG: gliding motility protein GldL [Flavobacteriaceae bacterium]|nr:gliding motility protein GldL [Flavobacteriaceae bacterium]MCY4267411.1 gliding motility protein GldL [Flavobacteriaceae bacterium]